MNTFRSFGIPAPAASASVRSGEVNAADPRYGTPGTRAAFVAALDAADAAAAGTIVRIPAGLTVDVVSTLSMSGRTCLIRGAGAGATGTVGNISVIKASAQTGPVINFDGYIPPDSFKGKVTPLSGVTIQGSGVADPTKVKSGIKMTTMNSAAFSDIAIMGTGGPCLEFAATPGNAVYLCDFDRFTLFTPVSAKANDVPYFYANECNGNVFNRFGFRSLTSTGDVGVSGAVVIEGNVSFSPYGNIFAGWWYEYLHPPTGGTLFAHCANKSIIQDFVFHDCEMEAGASSGTSFMRFTTPAGADYGGNIIRGLVNGDGNVSTYIHTGIDMRQSRNRVEGVRAYGGKHVTLAAGVDYTYVHLAGSESGLAGAPSAFVINTTGTHNVLIDEFNGDEWRDGVAVKLGGIPQPKLVAVTSSATLTPDVLSTDVFAVTALASAATIAAPTGTAPAGKRLLIRLKDNGTARALTWNAIYRTLGSALPASTAAGKTTYVSAVYNGVDSKWDVDAVETEGGQLFFAAPAPGSGTLQWGDGATLDTNLYRSAADTLATDDRLSLLRNGAGETLHITNANAGGDGMVMILNGTGNNALLTSTLADGAYRFRLATDGFAEWGDGTSARDTNLSRTAAGILGTNGSFAVTTAGKGLQVKEGSNAKQGVVTLVGGAKVVANTSVTASSRIQLTVQSLGTVAAPKAIAVTARTAGTSFTITSADGTDTSVVAYQIFEPA